MPNWIPAKPSMGIKFSSLKPPSKPVEAGRSKSLAGKNTSQRLEPFLIWLVVAAEQWGPQADAWVMR